MKKLRYLFWRMVYRLVTFGAPLLTKLGAHASFEMRQIPMQGLPPIKIRKKMMDNLQEPNPIYKNIPEGGTNGHSGNSVCY